MKMSRARSVRKEVVRSSTIQYDDKGYNLTLNESANVAFYQSNDVTRTLSDINSNSMDEWLQPRNTMNNIDLIHDNFLSTEDSEHCLSSDIDLNSILVTKDADTDPINELLLKTEAKCDDFTDFNTLPFENMDFKTEFNYKKSVESNNNHKIVSSVKTIKLSTNISLKKVTKKEDTTPSTYISVKKTIKKEHTPSTSGIQHLRKRLMTIDYDDIDDTTPKETALFLRDSLGYNVTVKNFLDNGKYRTQMCIADFDNYELIFTGLTADLTTELFNLSDTPVRLSVNPIEENQKIVCVKTAAAYISENLDGIDDKLEEVGIQADHIFMIKTDYNFKVWFCPEIGCMQIFNDLDTVKLHILRHFNYKTYKCNYPNCEWSFSTHFKLKRHQETHSKKKDFACNVLGCDRKFTTIYNLNTHIKQHERPAIIDCLINNCAEKFQTKRAMENHLKTHDKDMAPYKCQHPQCGKKFYNATALTLHSRCHQHKESELRCNWVNCGRMFKNPCRLKAHILHHTGDKPFACEYQSCMWAFSTASKLRRHELKHLNQRSFRCTIGTCEKAFMRSEHLKEHTMTHFIQKGFFECKDCNKKWSSKKLMLQHTRKYHRNETNQGTSDAEVEASIQSLQESEATVISISSEDDDRSIDLPFTCVRPLDDMETIIPDISFDNSSILQQETDYLKNLDVLLTPCEDVCDISEATTINLQDLESL